MDKLSKRMIAQVADVQFAPHSVTLTWSEEVAQLEQQVERLETKVTMCEMALRVAHLPLPPYETVLAQQEEVDE